MTDAFEYQNQFRRGPEFFGACSVCGDRASHKIEEDLFYGDSTPPFGRVHPLTTELCSPCFKRVFMNYDGKRSPPGLDPALPADAGTDERLDQALSALLAPPEESPLKIAILGVKRQPGEPEPIHITTREEYLAAFPGSSPPRSLFETETVTVIEVQDVETAAAAPWPVPYPLEKPGPETVLLEDAIDRSTWGTPGIDHLPSPHPIARIDIAPPISPLYFGDDYPRLARRKS